MRYDGVSFRWSAVGERGGEDDAGSFVLCVPNSIGEYFVVGFVRYEKADGSRTCLLLVHPFSFGLRSLVGYSLAGALRCTSFAGVSVALLLCAGVLIVTMRVPFRAPLEPSWCTFDRFWLPRGFRLFVPLMGVAFSAGLMLGQYRDVEFYLFLAVGFWLALWGHHFFFRGKLQTELAVGFVVLSASALLWGLGGDMEGMEWSIALCLGSGLGFVTSRYLLSYIRICEHCERGTAQTSYLLGWDAGLWAGYSVSFGLRTEVGETIYTYIMGAIFVGMGMFHLFWTRLWYMRNKRK